MSLKVDDLLNEAGTDKPTANSNTIATLEEAQSFTGVKTFSDTPIFNDGFTVVSGSGTDYEEGTFTPTLVGGGTFSITSASYTKIGDLCTIQLYVQSVAPTANTAPFKIGGLPFAHVGSNRFNSGNFGFSGDGNLSGIGCMVSSGSAEIQFNYIDGTGTASINNNQMIALLLGSTDSIILQITYMI